MNRLKLLMRRWGTGGAVDNARTELVLAETRARTASHIALRVRDRDTARAAASLMPTRGTRAA